MLRADGQTGKEGYPVARKRLTQRFPFLLPLRRWQRRVCFYLKMRLDFFDPLW